MEASSPLYKILEKVPRAIFLAISSYKACSQDQLQYLLFMSSLNKMSELKC